MAKRTTGAGGRWARVMTFVTASALAAAHAAAGGMTVTVPGDYATIQEAVDAVQSDGDPGEVVVESDSVFDETVLITESVILRAGEGFSPTIERNGAPVGPLRIFATEDESTFVAVRGLTLRLIDGQSVVSVSNQSEDESLLVELAGLTIEGQDVQQGVITAAGEGGLTLFLLESSVEIVGAGVGNPVGLRLEPFGFDLGAILAGNRIRFSRADGLRVRAGDDDDTVQVVAIANVFEGFESNDSEGRRGVDLNAFSISGVDVSTAELFLASNLLVGTDVAIRARSFVGQEIELTASNNTIVGSRSHAVDLGASGDSTMTANLGNNVIVGNLGGMGGDGFAVLAEVSDQAVIDLDNGHNLLFDNVGGDYGGIAVPGPGDVFADPRFVDPAAGNYRLGSGSPAIDAGDNDRCVGFCAELDLDAAPRIVDGDLDGVAVVDIGAYERAGQPLEVPALSSAALLGFAALLAGAAAWRLRRRPLL